MRKSLCENTTLQRIRDFKGKAAKGPGEAGGTARELVQVAGATCMALGLLAGNWGLERNHLKILFVLPDEEVHCP